MALPTVWTEGKTPLIDVLHARLTAIYGDKFGKTSDMAYQVWRETWANVLAEQGITTDEVKHGLSVCATQHPWPPTLPEFIQACRPPVDLETLFVEAVNGLVARRDGRMGRWSSPEVYWAAVIIGGDMLSHSYSQLKHRWKDALERARREQRGPIPEPMSALPAPGRTVAMPEQVQQAIREMAARLRGS